jgi:RecA/RadA recombinase
MGIEDFLKYANKRVGHNVIETGDVVTNETYVSSGIFLIDLAFMGGIPENTVFTFVGNPGAGKTTNAYKAIANFQRKYPDKYCLFINLEKSYDPVWAAKNGVNLERLLVVTPTNAEEAVDLACEGLENDDVCLVVFDSIPALVGSKELEKSAEDALQPGSVAHHSNRMFRRVSSIMSKAYNAGKKKTFIAIQQWRVGIGSAPNMPRTMPGGKYFYHYTSIVVDIKNAEVLGRDENDIQLVDHNDHSFKVIKARAGNSIREGEYVLIRNTADTLPVGTVNDFSTVVRYAQRFNLVGGAGKGWWMIDDLGEKLNFGSREAVVDYVRENADFYERLKIRIISLHRKKNGLREDGWY